MSSSADLYYEMRRAAQQPLLDRKERLIEKLKSIPLSAFTFEHLKDLTDIANAETLNYKLELALGRIEAVLAKPSRRGKKPGKKPGDAGRRKKR